MAVTTNKCFSTSLLLAVFAVYFCVGEVIDKTIVSARIESCKGCQLNRLHEVKKFIFEDVPLFNDVVFIPIQGATPELIFLNGKDQEVERIRLAPFSREECNNLLIEKGFTKTKAEAAHTDF